MDNKYTRLGICPKCDSDALDYGDSHLEGIQMYYEVSCDNCGWEGMEWFTLHFTEYTDNAKLTTFYIGDRIIIETLCDGNEEYMIAHTEWDKICLVCMEDSRRWTDAFKVKDSNAITYDEIDTHVNRKWHKKEV